MSFLFSYPDPPSITFISDNTFFIEDVLNLWNPVVFKLVNPTVLIPNL